MDASSKQVVDFVNHPPHYQTKNGLEDLKKARWYLDRLISHVEKHIRIDSQSACCASSSASDATVTTAHN